MGWRGGERKCCHHAPVKKAVPVDLSKMRGGRARERRCRRPERARVAAAELRSCRARACVAKALDEPCAPLSAAALEVPSANVRHPRARAAVPQALKQKSTGV